MIQRKIANLNEGFPLSLKVGIIFCQRDDKSERSVATLDGVMEIWTDPIYCFSDVFPEAKINSVTSI